MHPQSIPIAAAHEPCSRTGAPVTVGTAAVTDRHVYVYVVSQGTWVCLFIAQDQASLIGADC